MNNYLIPDLTKIVNEYAKLRIVGITMKNNNIELVDFDTDQSMHIMHIDEPRINMNAYMCVESSTFAIIYPQKIDSSIIFGCYYPEVRIIYRKNTLFSPYRRSDNKVYDI